MPNTVSAKGEPTSQAFSADVHFHLLAFRQNSISCSEGVNKRTAHSLSPRALPPANFGVRESDQERDPPLPLKGGPGRHVSPAAVRQQKKVLPRSCTSRVGRAQVLTKSETVAGVLLVYISYEMLFSLSGQPLNGLLVVMKSGNSCCQTDSLIS